MNTGPDFYALYNTAGKLVTLIWYAAACTCDAHCLSAMRGKQSAVLVQGRTSSTPSGFTSSIILSIDFNAD